MPSSDILRIVLTVAAIQLGCDIFARYRIFGNDKYKRAVSNLEKAIVKRDKLKEEADTKKKEKLVKRYEVAERDCNDAAAEVARLHTMPNMWTSFVFFVLLQILGSEHKGKVMALLPFAPFSILRRLTMRGLDFGDLETTYKGSEDGGIHEVNQAASFMCIYVLATLSVKYYVSQLAGVKPPKGADNGLMTIMESSHSQKFLKQMGVDPADLDAMKRS